MSKYSITSFKHMEHIHVKTLKHIQELLFLVIDMKQCYEFIDEDSYTNCKDADG